MAAVELKAVCASTSNFTITEDDIKFFNGRTIEEVQPASSSSMTLSEGIPNEDVAHEDDAKKNWSNAEVKALIHLYEENKASFENNFIRRKDIWQKITKKLNNEGGTTFSVEEVDKKWRNLKDRYKRNVEMKKQTGKGKSKWQFFDLMGQMLQKDPAVNPPRIARARCSHTVETAEAATLTEGSQEQKVFPPVPSTSPPPAAPASSKKRSRSNDDDDAPQWVICLMEGAEARNKKARKLLKKVYKEEKRRNDLFERFLDMKCSSDNDNNT
uniref:MADF domain-containing protein n=2 Tax=Eptatretus burgeri TaxID=7764 RepID=A0A8C4X0W4_EPTBU